ncbi:MAG: Beta-lactamase class C-like and penicillin binding proteins (PBPs) superfamily [uncultured Thermomicrobiales bacterium]|uniref:Beta-lactamase class C-like and penicillin binding proteins (PBPs) superfamily n=1 Tax=uncultured Thermomicrobiales bacterium TaxID=1645740 RepID=A0A6J4UE49_9BACT|nr:MAG: Beta-lactamase class C-like and penicillin binding proteins (PBPs) superfamily [uncultured Thermomicrobiales bacterium]
MGDPDAVLARIEAFAGRRLAESGCPGLAVGITDRERTLGVVVAGTSDLAGTTPIGTETLFEIGSIGKTFTAVALLQDHAAGRLDLHAPVTDYLPWFAVRSTHPMPTVHHFLTHTAGIIAGMDGTPGGMSEVCALRHTETGGPPGERFHYSNVGYKVLGLILERVADKPYGDVVKERILDPLGMTATDPTITNETRRRLAVGHAPWYDDRPYRQEDGLVPANWIETDTGDGCLASTADDMARFLRMLLNRGAGPDGRILDETGFGLLTQRANLAWDDQRYGYGTLLFDRDGHAHVAHTGYMVGFSAYLVGDVDAGLGAVVLANATTVGPEAIADRALALLRAAREGRQSPPDPPSDEATPEPVSIEPEGTVDPTTVIPAPPAEWIAYPGAYRSHNPWVPFARVALTGGVLRLILPSGPDGFGDDQPLVPVPDGSFRAGDDPGTPERARFDIVVEGKALRLVLSGADFWRI